MNNNSINTRRLITEEALTAIERVRDYLWEEEFRHFEEAPTTRHIFRELQVIDGWLAHVRSTESK